MRLIIWHANMMGLNDKWKSMTTISAVEMVGQHEIAWMHDRAISTIVTIINSYSRTCHAIWINFHTTFAPIRSQSTKKREKKNTHRRRAEMMIIINDIFTKLMCQLCYAVLIEKRTKNNRETVLYILSLFFIAIWVYDLISERKNNQILSRSSVLHYAASPFA